MTYKGFEIFARVGGTYSDLYSLKRNGELNKESEDIIIYNGDEEVVWYETDGDHVLDDFDNPCGFKTLESCKAAIDKYVETVKDYE